MTRHFKKGEIVLREGDFANRFYLIKKGKVTLESSIGLGETEVLDTICPGDLLGWSWMFPPHVWHFTARAVEATTAIFFYGTILRERPHVRLRTFQTHERGNDQALTTIS